VGQQVGAGSDDDEEVDDLDWQLPDEDDDDDEDEPLSDPSASIAADGGGAAGAGEAARARFFALKRGSLSGPRWRGLVFPDAPGYVDYPPDLFDVEVTQGVQRTTLMMRRLSKIELAEARLLSFQPSIKLASVKLGQDFVKRLGRGGAMLNVLVAQMQRSLIEIFNSALGLEEQRSGLTAEERAALLSRHTDLVASETRRLMSGLQTMEARSIAPQAVAETPFDERPDHSVVNPMQRELLLAREKDASMHQALLDLMMSRVRGGGGRRRGSRGRGGRGFKATIRKVDSAQNDVTEVAAAPYFFRGRGGRGRGRGKGDRGQGPGPPPRQ
jgi:hypothetical protein